MEGALPMVEKHAQMLRDIESMVAQSGVQDFLDPYPFRDRPQHMYRCYCWARRILATHPEADAELTLVATLFHDIGVIRCTPDYPKADHDALGGPIVREYLLAHGYEADFADRAAYLVMHHQQRELIQSEGTPIEHVILMEADMLDERGALGIVWDAMAEGASSAQSYAATLERFKQRKLYRRPDRNPMHTEAARAFWAEKQRLHVQFIAALERDLGLEE